MLSYFFSGEVPTFSVVLQGKDYSSQAGGDSIINTVVILDITVLEDEVYDFRFGGHTT